MGITQGLSLHAHSLLQPGAGLPDRRGTHTRARSYKTFEPWRRPLSLSDGPAVARSTGPTATRRKRTTRQTRSKCVGSTPPLPSPPPGPPAATVPTAAAALRHPLASPPASPLALPRVARRPRVADTNPHSTGRREEDESDDDIGPPIGSTLNAAPREEEEEEDEEDEGPRGPRLPDSPPFTANVRQLKYEVNEDDLREFFTPCGTITDTVVIRDRETGKSKGFGFVTFEVPGWRPFHAPLLAPRSSLLLTPHSSLLTARRRRRRRHE